MDLENHYDVVIIGTGLIESILSAACSRVGKRVLHLDSNSFYGKCWASFTFKQLVEFLKFGKVSTIFNEEDSLINDFIQANENVQIIEWNNLYETISNIEIISYLITDSNDIKSEETNTKNQNKNNEDEWWTENKFKKFNMKFNIDLCPRVLFSKGSMVELLVQSNVSRYMSFKAVTRLLFNKDQESQQLIEIPFSKQTVFRSENLSLIEKNLLIKFIKFCLNTGNQEELEKLNSLRFVELMSSKEISLSLQKIILNCIVFCKDDNILSEEALVRIRKFVESTGKYGETPFLSTIYGSGEIPQSFCRLSAVFGGTFLLDNKIDKLIVENQQLNIVHKNKKISCDYLLTGVSSTPSKLTKINDKKLISRAILITNKSIKTILKDENLNRECTFICLNVGENKPNVYILEYTSSLCVCPNGFYLVYLWTDNVTSTAKNDLLPVVKKYFNFTSKINEQDSLKPAIIWSCYYNIESVDGNSFNQDLVNPNHFILSSPINELDYDQVISESKQLFIKMYPDEEFMPRAPEPDEIVFNQESQVEDQTNGLNE